MTLEPVVKVIGTATCIAGLGWYAAMYANPAALFAGWVRVGGEIGTIQNAKAYVEDRAHKAGLI